MVQARRIEPGLRDKLVQGDFCAGNQPSFLKKNTLKQISHALIEIVQSEASIDSLCSRLQVRTNYLVFGYYRQIIHLRNHFSPSMGTRQELRTSPVVNSELENFNNLLGGKISMTASGKDTNPSTQEESRSIITGKAGTSDQQPGPKYFTRLSRDDDREENSSLSSFDSSISESSVSGSSDSVRNSEGGHVEVTTVTSTDETIL